MVPRDEQNNDAHTNADEIIDERGLAFAKNGKHITAYFTLRRTMPDGEVPSGRC